MFGFFIFLHSITPSGLYLGIFWAIHSSFSYFSSHISKSLISQKAVYFPLGQSSPQVSKGPLLFQFSGVSGLIAVFSDF